MPRKRWVPSAERAFHERASHRARNVRRLPGHLHERHFDGAIAPAACQQCSSWAHAQPARQDRQHRCRTSGRTRVSHRRGHAHSRRRDRRHIRRCCQRRRVGKSHAVTSSEIRPRTLHCRLALILFGVHPLLQHRDLRGKPTVALPIQHFAPKALMIWSRSKMPPVSSAFGP